jgi:hypothetical protein
VGATLKANTDALGGDGEISYTWQRGTTVIGTNSDTYDVQVADVGASITVTVTRSENSGSVTSIPTDVVVAIGAPTPGLAFILINNGTAYSVSKGTSTSPVVVIPAVHEGKPVTEIADSGFTSYENLTSIIIPEGVTSIGDGAFVGCYSLTSVIIPDSVTSIGDGAFSSCSGLTSITVASGNTVYRSDGNCIISIVDNTLMLGCKNSVIPSNVTSIGDIAFLGCSGLTSVTIPSSVTSIGNAFGDCYSLTSVTIPSGVTSIGSAAFSGCSGLTSITVSSGNTVYRSEGNCIIRIDDNELILGCKSSVIPSSVTSIGSAAFFGCRGLTSVTIPNGVTSIGSDAFGNCSGLTSVTIPSSVTSIGDSAFGSCSGLTSVTIPSSVTSIGINAFGGCSGLTSITIPASVTSIYDNAFSSCESLTSITFATGSNITLFGDRAFPQELGQGGNNLRTAYNTGGAGTYTRATNGAVWTKH